jgi:hypothetical protein
MPDAVKTTAINQTRKFKVCRRRTPEMGYPVPVFPITKAGIKTARWEPIATSTSAESWPRRQRAKKRPERRGILSARDRSGGVFCRSDASFPFSRLLVGSPIRRSLTCVRALGLHRETFIRPLGDRSLRGGFFCLRKTAAVRRRCRPRTASAVCRRTAKTDRRIPETASRRC